MGTSLGPLYFALMSIFASGSAWVLMWVTDRLYDWGLGLLAVPIRISIFFMQLGFLLGCLAIIIGSARTGDSSKEDGDQDAARYPIPVGQGVGLPP